MVTSTLALFIPGPGPGTCPNFTDNHLTMFWTAGESAVVEGKLLIVAAFRIVGGHCKPAVRSIGSTTLSPLFEEEAAESHCGLRMLGPLPSGRKRSRLKFLNKAPAAGIDL